MAKRTRRRENGRTKVKITYPKHWFSPEELLNYIELPQFWKRWEKLGLNDEADLVALQSFISVNPTGYPLLQGTHSIRKMRFAPPGWNMGKRGGFRVLHTTNHRFLCVGQRFYAAVNFIVSA